MPAWVSLFPPFTTLVLAVFSKRIIPSLVLGLWVGCFLETGRLVPGILEAGNRLVDVMAARENDYIIMFLFIFGSLSEMFAVSGGIKGFGRLADRYVKTERGACYPYGL